MSFSGDLKRAETSCKVSKLDKSSSWTYILAQQDYTVENRLGKYRDRTRFECADQRIKNKNCDCYSVLKRKPEVQIVVNSTCRLLP